MSDMTKTEKAVDAWVCELWADALKINTSEEWRYVRVSMFGATMATIWNGSTLEYVDYSFLGSIALIHQVKAIDDKYAKEAA